MSNLITDGLGPGGGLLTGGFTSGTSSPTTATLTGPTIGNVGTVSQVFTITLNRPATEDLTFPIAFSRGLVSASLVTIASGQSSATFTVTPTAPGTGALTVGGGTTGLTIVGGASFYTGTPAGGGNDIIKNAIKNFLMPTLKTFASQEVVYVRGNQSVAVQATYGQKLLRTHDQFGGLRIEWTDLDFIIQADDLHFDDGRLITPEKGDLIYVAVDSGDIQIYKVLPFGNDPPWRWSDPHNFMYRIHTKNTKTVSVTA